MAILSISRIQHRRGLQQDLPQLASAELGWSIDQQRLFIGNGTIEENSPYPGNTEILTAKSDILNLIQSYTYKNPDAGYVPATGSSGGTFTTIAYGNGKYVAVGQAGIITISTDAATWSAVASGTTNSLNHVCFGNGKFVAVGSAGTIISSSDGTVWTNASTLTSLTFTGIVWAQSIGNYVAVSNTGSVAYSADAIIWTVVSGVSVNSLNSIAYNAGTLIAVGFGGVITKSVNATTWTNLTSPVATSWQSVNFCNDRWVVTGQNSLVCYSTDSTNWNLAFTDTLRGSATNSLIIVMVGDGGAVYYTATTTPIAATSGVTGNLYDVAYSATDLQFVAVGKGGAIITSADGANWAVQSSGTSLDLRRIYYDTANSKYIVVGDTGTVLTSLNGSTWTSQTGATSQNLRDVTKTAAGIYVAVGDAGAVMTSTDTVTWTLRSTGVSIGLTAVSSATISSTPRIVAVGNSGTIITSDDAGVTWTQRVISSTQNLNSVRFLTWTYSAVTYNAFIAVGNYGTIFRSTDGINWALSVSPSSAHLTSIAYLKGNFWCLGSNGYTSIYGNDITVSDTLVTQQVITGNPTLYDSVYGGSKTVIVGQIGRTLASSDGVTYTTKLTHTFGANANTLLYTADLFNVIYSTEFVSVGDRGAILTSLDSETWAGIGYAFGTSATYRGIQNKFDDFVNVKDFGARGDGVTDDTAAINRALYQVYCVSLNPTARKALYFPGGKYPVSDQLKLPTNAILVGEGRNNSIIFQADISALIPVMATADSLQQTGAQAGTNGASNPGNVVIKDLGLSCSADGLWINNATNVSVERVNFVATTNFSNAADIYTGVKLQGTSLNPSSNIRFSECYFNGFSNAVYQSGIDYSLCVVFTNCVFYDLNYGASLPITGSNTQTMSFSNCLFKYISQSAIVANNATNLISTFNKFEDVGNNQAGIGSPSAEIIVFGSASIDCASINDQFDRPENAGVARISGNDNSVQWDGAQKLRMGMLAQSGGKKLTLLANQTAVATGLTYELDDNVLNRQLKYVISRNDKTRSGEIQITYDPVSTSFYLDDDYSQTADVGIEFLLTLSGTTLSLKYTSTSTAGVISMSVAERSLNLTW